MEDFDCCLDGIATRDPETDTFICGGCGSRVPVPGSAYDGTGPHRYRVEVRADKSGHVLVIGHTDHADGGKLRKLAEMWPGYTYRGTFDTWPADGAAKS